MHARERLREAYENVSFRADTTWTISPDAYQKSNLDLYLTEHHLQRKRLQANRPRTVRECIPESRLAQYANYVYNESREMSYSSHGGYVDSLFATPTPSEPWEMPEVGDLYRWFLKTLPEDSFSRLEGSYESPLLSVNGFEDKILKIQLTEDRVKNIWSTDNPQFHDRSKSSQMVVNFFTSPLKNFFLFDHDYDREWFRSISISHDFQQLEDLSKAFKDQNNLISKLLSGTSEGTSSEPTSTEILYSEVLQGLSPSRKFLSTVKPVPKPSGAEDSQPESFTNYTVLNQRQEETAKNDSTAFPPVSQFPTVPQAKFVQQKATLLQTERCKYPLPQGRTSLLPFSPSYVQQTYFYPPVQTVQRWIPLNVANSYYPPQIFAPTWINQTPPVEVNRIFVQNPVNTVKVSSDRNSCDVFKRNSSLASEPAEDVDLNQFKEDDSFLEEHRVSASISEELEIQALEQYSTSNENFYQDLERQAQEQYTSSPDEKF